MGVDSMRSEQGSQACLGVRSPLHVVWIGLLPNNKKSLSHSLLGVSYGY
jgi:hypothetical protein